MNNTCLPLAEAARKVLEWLTLRGHSSAAMCALQVAVKHEKDERRDTESLINYVRRGKWEEAQSVVENIDWRRKAIQEKYKIPK